VLPHQIRTISHERLRERLAVVDDAVLAEVTRRLAVLTRGRR
jgi:mRNA-degrading endonuclease toxin of MazEF toxin-antitoxin module